MVLELNRKNKTTNKKRGYGLKGGGIKIDQLVIEYTLLSNQTEEF